MPQGSRIRLRRVTLGDSGYFQRQHISPDFGRDLSAAAPSAAEQDAWIKAYRRRKAEEREYSFKTAPTDDDRHFGAILIKSDDATWGSFTLVARKPEKTTLDPLSMVRAINFARLNLCCWMQA